MTQRASGELTKHAFEHEQLGIGTGAEATIDIGSTITSGTAGSVLFIASGPVLGEDNANFFWDDSNNRLGIGTASPSAKLDVRGASDTVQLRVREHSTQTLVPFVVENSAGSNIFEVQPLGGITVNEQGSDTDSRFEGDNDAQLLYIDAGADRVGVGTTNPQSRFEILGRADEAQERIICNATQTTAPWIIADSAGNRLIYAHQSGGLVVNEQGADSDTRVEGDTDINLLFVDAGVNRVGIGTGTPGAKHDIVGTADEVQQRIIIYTGGGGQTLFPFLIEEPDGDNLFYVNPFGGFVANDTGYDTDCRIEGDTDANLFYTDASADFVGIGTATPATKLDVNGVINAATGYRIANAAVSGNFLGGNGTNFVSTAPGALTKTDDTNVTLTLGGAPTTALLTAASLTLGWTGTLAAARLNANVVQAITNDTNVTGSIALQTLTLGWTGQLSIARGGTGQSTATAAFDALAPTTTLGDVIYHDGTDNVRLAGNITTTKKFLRQTGNGVVSAAPAWDTLVAGDIPTLDHGGLSGLTDDDHTQYALLAGRSGGQTLTGGTASGDDLKLRSTTHATKGDIILNDEGGHVLIGGGASASELRIYEPSPGLGINYTAFKAQTQAADITYTLPADDGDRDEFLKTDGSGSLTWEVPAHDGWLPANETWEYASATTITVPTDATTKYAKGDRIKMTQTSVKYFVVTGVTATVLTVSGGTDYTVANAAISENYYSHGMSPVGYPHWFNQTAPTWAVATFDNGAGGQPTTTKYKFRIDGSTCQVTWAGSGTKAGTNNYLQVTAIVTPAGTFSNQPGAGMIHPNSVGIDVPGVFLFSSGANWYLEGPANITDNTVIAVASFSISYEF